MNAVYEKEVKLRRVGFAKQVMKERGGLWMSRVVNQNRKK